MPFLLPTERKGQVSRKDLVSSMCCRGSKDGQCGEKARESPLVSLRGNIRASPKERTKERAKEGNRDQCRICGQSGHWRNECPNKQHVNEVSSIESPQKQSATTNANPATMYRQSGDPLSRLVPLQVLFILLQVLVAFSVYVCAIFAAPPNELEEFDFASDSNSATSYRTSSDFRACAVFKVTGVNHFH